MLSELSDSERRLVYVLRRLMNTKFIVTFYEARVSHARYAIIYIYYHCVDVKSILIIKFVNKLATVKVTQ